MSLFWKNLKKNSFSKFIRNGVILLQGVFLTPIVVDFLGLKGASVWFLLTQFTAYLQLLEFGVPTALTRMLSNSKFSNNDSTYSAYFFLCFAFLSIIALLLCLFSTSIASLFLDIFDISDESLLIPILFAIIATALCLPFRCGLGVLMSKQLFFIHLWIEILIIISKIVIIAILYSYEKLSFVNLVYIYYSSFFIIYLLQYIYALRYVKFPSVFLIMSSLRHTYRKTFSLCAAVLLVTASATLLRQGSPFLLGIIEGSSENISVFTISVLIFSIATQFITLPLGFVAPQASVLYSENNFSEIYKIFKKFTFVTLTATTVLIAMYGILGEYFISLWINQSQSSTYQIFKNSIILMIVFTFTIHSLYARSILSFVNKHISVAFIEIIIISTSLLVAFMLVYYAGLSTNGMLISLSLIYLLRAYGPLSYLIADFFKIKKSHLYIEIYRNYLNALIPALLLFIILSKFIYYKFSLVLFIITFLSIIALKSNFNTVLFKKDCIN